jgi:hypothetical protein
MGAGQLNNLAATQIACGVSDVAIGAGVEHMGMIPLELRPLMSDWVFGCDICQDVCPWNRFAPPAREARLHARTLDGWTLERFLGLDEAGFAELFAGSPIRRAQREGFLRNCAWRSAIAVRHWPRPALSRRLHRSLGARALPVGAGADRQRARGRERGVQRGGPARRPRSGSGRR